MKKDLFARLCVAVATFGILSATVGPAVAAPAAARVVGSAQSVLAPTMTVHHDMNFQCPPPWTKFQGCLNLSASIPCVTIYWSFNGYPFTLKTESPYAFKIKKTIPYKGIAISVAPYSGSQFEWYETLCEVTRVKASKKGKVKYYTPLDYVVYGPSGPVTGKVYAGIIPE